MGSHRGGPGGVGPSGGRGRGRLHAAGAGGDLHLRLGDLGAVLLQRRARRGLGGGLKAGARSLRGLRIGLSDVISVKVMPSQALCSSWKPWPWHCSWHWPWPQPHKWKRSRSMP